MKMLKKFILSLIVLSGTSMAYGQHAQLRFQRYSLLDGLSHCYVGHIVQDHKGFIWIGTHKGLNRFDGYHFEQYLNTSDDPDSLGAHMISDIIEDSKNRLWVSSSSGTGGLFLYQRDKDRFLSYFSDAGYCIDPEDNRIYDMIEDQEGNFLLATNIGIIRFNPDEKDPVITEFKNIPDDLSSLTSGQVNVLLIDSRNWLWVGSSNGLDLYDQEDDCFIHFRYQENDPYSIGSNQVTDILEDPFGTIWIGTREGGLNRVSLSKPSAPAKESISFIRHLHDPSYPKTISNNVINALSMDDAGNLWIGTDEGINKLDRKSLLLTRAEPGSPPEFICYKNNPLDNESLNYNFVRSLFFDVTGTLWAGTSTGLNKQKNYKFQTFQQNVTENSLASNKIQTFFEEGRQNIWIGSSKGLNLFDRRDHTFDFILRGAILSVCKDQEGYIWIGQWHKGLKRYDPRTGESVSFRHSADPNSLGGDHIFTTYVDRRNNVWICTWGGGLNLYNREMDNFTRFIPESGNDSSLTDDHICAIHEDRKGVLWVGTLDGLSRLVNREEGTFASYKKEHNNPASISNNFINCIYETNDGTLWIGTEEGLNKYNRTGDNFISYTRVNGLLDDCIRAILEDDHGNLWVSTNNGISKIKMCHVEDMYTEPYLHEGYSFVQSPLQNDPTRLFVKNFDVDDGLQSREFIARASLKTWSGEMLFGGINGFNMFHPDSLKYNLIPPEVILTNLQLFNKDVSIGEIFNGDTILHRSIAETEEVELSHKNNVFSIEFAALHFIAPDQNQYAYKLEGFDNQWIMTSDRKASYTNLNPGEYLFMLKASNNDGVWSEAKSILKIVIAPPFWKTWWFKALIIAMIIGMTFIIIEVRIHSVKKHKKELEIKVKERTSQVVMQKEQIENQALKIQQMNRLLKQHNIELEDSLYYLSEARVMQKLIGFDEFSEIYPDEKACCLFLEKLKWNEGYTCKKCGGHEFSKEDATLVRRCRKCNYKESVTCGTIFHRLRFPINKAFYILILTSTGREINITQLSQTIDLRMKTCWEFHNKVKEIMATRKRFKNHKEGWKELILLKKEKTRIPSQLS
ncbi:MAG: two-component regulator propeller domain-containing protein [Bacteroidales bacterium]